MLPRTERDKSKGWGGEITRHLIDVNYQAANRKDQF